jgi:hypothetical protein
MGKAINWMAYMWLITSETIEELFYRSIGDFFRRFTCDVETRERAMKAEPRIFTCQDTAAEAPDTI